MLLPAQTNTIKVFFLNMYSAHEGLATFTDKADGQQYIKTLFEADFCHYIFPCFDQIDLKARISLQAVIEGDWTLVSTELPIADPDASVLKKLKQDCDEAVGLFTYQRTEPQRPKLVVLHETCQISVHNVSICVGPFLEKQRSIKGFPVLKIFARQSVIEQVNLEEMFDVVEAGITFF